MRLPPALCWLLGHRYERRNIETRGVFVVYDIVCRRCGESGWSNEA